MKPADIRNEVNQAIQHLSGAVPDVDGCLAHILSIVGKVRAPMGCQLPLSPDPESVGQREALRYALSRITYTLPNCDLLALLVAAAEMRAEAGE